MEEQKIEQEIQTCFQIMQSMDTLYEAYARKNGLTYMSLYILETIYEKKGCTQKFISGATLYPKQTVNIVIRSFLEKGWVVLEQDAEDRRSKYIRLTEAGDAMAQRVIEPFWDAAADAFGELGAQERSLMIRTLKTFTDSFAEKVRAL